MEVAAEFLTSSSELHAFNRVQMLHNVVSLADVASANGRYIDCMVLKEAVMTSNGLPNIM